MRPRTVAGRAAIGLASAFLTGCDPAAATAAAAPIVITRGGTYTGHWASDDAEVAAVTVRTAEPVLIERATVTGRGTLIAVSADHADVTVRDVFGTGENPGVPGRPPGRFVSAVSFDRVAVEHCRLDHTAGIYLLANAGGRDGAVRVVGNAATDIDGRLSDGRGGWVPYNDRRNRRDGHAEHGYAAVQFLQLDKVHAGGVDVSWNLVVNEPGASRVEDNLSVYESGGTAASPMLVHDNCVRGAYDLDPARRDQPADAEWTYSWDYSGGGLMLGDGPGRTPASAASFVVATANVVVGTGNYGIAISAGHDVRFDRNTIVSSGTLPDGRPVAAENVGAYVWDAGRGRSRGTFFADGGDGNVIGWVKGAGRNDSWTPDAAFWTATVHRRGPITPADEAAAVAAWKDRATRAGVTIGPRP